MLSNGASHLNYLSANQDLFDQFDAGSSLNIVDLIELSPKTGIAYTGGSLGDNLQEPISRSDSVIAK